MCREVFLKFKACINIKGVNQYQAEYGAINVIYKSLQKDREKADMSDIIRQLHQVVDEAIEPWAEYSREDMPEYDISKIDFDRLRREFEKCRTKKTVVQNLKQAIEEKTPAAA